MELSVGTMAFPLHNGFLAKSAIGAMNSHTEQIHSKLMRKGRAERLSSFFCLLSCSRWCERESSAILHTNGYRVNNVSMLVYICKRESISLMKGNNGL
jgi:hypothetical protein